MAESKSLRGDPSTAAASAQDDKGPVAAGVSPALEVHGRDARATETPAATAEPAPRKLMTVVFSHNRAAYYVAQIAGEKKMWLETARRPGDAPYLTPQTGFLGAVACTGGWRKAYDLNWSSLWAESRETRAEDDALVVDYAAAAIVAEVQ